MPRPIVILIALSFLCAGCAPAAMPAMNQTQADAYNQCEGKHWSSLADMVLFGVPGYLYKEHIDDRCLTYAMNERSNSEASIDRQPIGTAQSNTVPTSTAN